MSKLTTTQITTLRAIDDGADNSQDLAFELEISASAGRARVAKLVTLGLVHSGLGSNAEGTGRNYLCFELTLEGISKLEILEANARLIAGMDLVARLDKEDTQAQAHFCAATSSVGIEPSVLEQARHDADAARERLNRAKIEVGA